LGVSQSRSSQGESHIPVEYLIDCDKHHEEFIIEQLGQDVKKLMINGDDDIYKHPTILTCWMEMIRVFILDKDDDDMDNDILL
jgi:hypothetical protein